MSSDRFSRRSFLAALGVSTASLAGCQVPGLQAAQQTEATDNTPSAEQSGETSVYTQVYNQVSDAVVSIRVYSQYGAGSQGSGFLLNDSQIVTNEHVVSSGDAYYVRFEDTDWREVSITGTDVYSDLAVLNLDDTPDSAEPLSFVDSTPEIGTRVVAIGNPFGLSGSVSEGIVSGVNRALQGANNFSIAAGIQTDAAVNPGNSGGPLVNLDGDALGVINSGGGDNVGFAISAQLAERVVPALIDDGSYDHPYMGVSLQSVSPLIADANDLDDASGVYIASALPDGPSEGVLQGSTGTRRINSVDVEYGGDIIRQLDDTPIETRQDLATYLALETSPEDILSVSILRDGSEETVELRLGTRPEP